MIINKKIFLSFRAGLAYILPQKITAKTIRTTFWQAKRWKASLVWVGETTCVWEGMLWVHPSQGTSDQDGCLLFYGPLWFPSVLVTAPNRLKSLKNILITSSGH